MGFPMMITSGQQYNVGEKKPTVILDTYIVVTSGYQVLCDTGSSFLPKYMYVWSTLSAEYDMDQPGVVARTSSNSRLCELRIDYLIKDGRGPQWRPESAETFIFRNTLWPSGRFLRGIFSKNYLGWRGTKISLKISSGAQSENLEPSLTIQEFFSKKYSWFLCSVCVPFLGS